MSVGDIASLASAFIALVALILSGVALRISMKYGATTDRLNLLQIEREQAEGILLKKADLSANIVKISSSKLYLRVFNRGKGIAHNVRLLDLDPDKSVLMPDDISRKYPVPQLHQHQSIDLILVYTLSSSPSIHIKLFWDDETGKNHENEHTLVI